MKVEGKLRDELLALSREIHADPELAYEERRAADRICALLEKHGHKVERKLGGLETAFRARIGPAGPSVALLAEYDALPGIGHACGHNLIAMATVGAFLAVDPKGLEVGVELIGTPAEEKGGGKIDLIEAGAFKGTVAALFSHPSSGTTWECAERLLGITSKRVTFRGVAAHAAVSPDRGRNALNGVIRLFVGVDGWRQQLRESARVHGIVTEGGVAQNIIPERAQAVFGLRAEEMGELREMERAFEDIARGAALQTGTQVEIEQDMRVYAPTVPHPRITALLLEELTARGVRAGKGDLVKASGDIGNVSQLVPTDYIGFPVTTTGVPGHSHAMREAAITDLAHQNAFITAEALAATARRIATDKALRAELRA